MGVGTTGVVATKKNRSFIGIELNEIYYKICKKEIKSFSQNDCKKYNHNYYKSIQGYLFYINRQKLTIDATFRIIKTIIS